MSSPRALWLALPLLLPLFGGHAAWPEEDVQAGLAAAIEALEAEPASAERLAVASQAAESAGDGDRALWYARLALHEARAEGWPDKRIEALSERVAKLDPLPVEARPRLAERSRRLFELGMVCVRKKLYANAVEYFERCYGTPAEPDAAAQLAKLYRNKKTIAALLDTGLDVPVHHRRSRADRRRIREDAKHESWKEAWRVKSQSYTVHTNVGWEVANAISRSMEQMNGFYQAAYLGKRAGGKTSRCVIDVYKTHDEFIEHTGNTDALGFYVPGQNRVAAFDPRSEGGTLRELYETLYHEVSHQFTHLVCRSTVPSWLNEGLATYFESARTLAGGRVEVNLVNHGRLQNLQQALGDEYPTVEEVVSYYEPGSYPADYYCVGWGLTFFFKNYENEKHERVYAPHFDAYLKSYEATGEHDSFARFVDYFVTRPKEPGVDSFADLERRFRTWIDGLHGLAFSGAEAADELVARARGQAKAGKKDAALESYRWALRKRPGDPAALEDLAELHTERKEKDAALYRWRRLLAQLEPESEGAAKCRARIGKLEKTLLPAEAAIHEDFVAQITTAAKAYVEAKLPRSALWTLDTALLILDGDDTLSIERQRIRAESGVETWRWLRVPVVEPLRAWYPVGPWRAEAGVLVASSDEALENLVRETPPARHRFEVTVQLATKTSKSFAGIIFGHAEDGVWDVYGVTGRGRVEVNRILDDWKLNKFRERVRDRGEDEFRLAVEVDRGTVRFFLNDEVVETRTYPPEELLGRVGVVIEAAEARFTNVRLGT